MWGVFGEQAKVGVYKVVGSWSKPTDVFNNATLHNVTRLLSNELLHHAHFPLQQRIDTYFSRVNDIIKKGKISSRIRFALQDVVDLRENNWVPRLRQESQVKTIDQIHREAQDEEQLTKQMASQYVGGSGGMYGRRGDSRPVDDKRRGSKPGPGGEEWSKVEKRPQQSRPDLERIRSIKKPGDKEKESSGLRAVSKWGNKGAATTSVAPEALRQVEKLSKPPSRLAVML